MNQTLYRTIEAHMLQCMKDSAHDKGHIYRVLYMALDIATYEEDVDREVLIISCLLHDIGREEQFKNPEVCHAQIGSRMAYEYLQTIGYEESKASHVRECIQSHRYRRDNDPCSMEAKILFDADKIDATGAIGIARTLVYKGIVSEPLYSLDEKGNVLDGTSDSEESFFHEYKYKLEKLYGRFYTNRAEQIAKLRQHTADLFYQGMLREIKDCYHSGTDLLTENLE
jgi:uncharacterized protein